MQSDVQQYWNNVERAVSNQGKVFRDNFVKRRMLVEALLRYPLRGAKILELGTGAGLTAYTLSMANGSLTYTGLDISETYAKGARERFGLDVIVADLTERLPVPDKLYDVVFAFDCLEHIQPEKRGGLFKELNRVMAQDDRLILINNPLNESRHDPRYDFELLERDIATLCEITDTRILEVKLLASQGYNYQFIALGTFKQK